jgi:hypothetical protein
MRSMLRVAVLAWYLAPSIARAHDLMIDTVEHGRWALTIAALQLDLHSEGEKVHVLVRDAHGWSPCGTYALTLDAAGIAAFDIGECDPSTSATELTLVHRAALFDHGDAPPRPREIEISATLVENVQVAGGAHVTAGSAVWCTAEVQPFLPDLENGIRVALTPDRYRLSVSDGQVRITHDATHWTLARVPGGPTLIGYDIEDSLSGQLVLHGAVALGCAHADDPVIAPPVHDVVGTLATARPKPWGGHALSVGLLHGLSVLQPSGLQFKNATGSIAASALGLRDTAAGALGIDITYERPWLFVSGAFASAMAPLADRTLYALVGWLSIGTTLKAGPCGFYAGANLAVSSYQLSGQGSALLEWKSEAELGVGAATGMRVHLRGRGVGMAVLGLDLSAPIVGQQPWFVVASLGGGFGR